MKFQIHTVHSSDAVFVVFRGAVFRGEGQFKNCLEIVERKTLEGQGKHHGFLELSWLQIRIDDPNEHVVVVHARS